MKPTISLSSVELDINKISPEMPYDVMESMFPRIYDAALRRLKGDFVTEEEMQCVRKWLEFDEEFRLLNSPDDIMYMHELEFGDNFNGEKHHDAIVEQKELREELEKFGFDADADISMSELEFLKDIEVGAKPNTIRDPTVLWRYLMDYLNARINCDEDIDDVVASLLKAKKYCGEKDFFAEAVNGIVRDFTFIRSGPTAQIVDEIRHRYDHLTNYTPGLANMVVNYCYELGTMPSVRDVMLLNSPATYGLTKKKFEDSFSMAQQELETLYLKLDAKESGGILMNAIDCARKKNSLTSANLFQKPGRFFGIAEWYDGKEWFADLYSHRLNVCALHWPGNIIQSKLQILYGRYKMILVRNKR